MPTNVAFRNFSSGEVSPAFYAATDRAAYARGLRTCRNATVLRTGGLTNRPGTQYLGSTKADGVARLIPCVFSDEFNFLLEFGDGYVRFWRDGELLQGTVSGAWADASAYLQGVIVSNGGTNYVCLQSHTSSAANDEPGVGANWEDYWYALTDTIYELPTPYQDTDLDALRYAALPFQLVLVHPSYAVRTLSLVSTALVWWGIEVETFIQTSQDAPTNLVASVGGTGGFTYGVTAVDAEGNESELSNTDETNNTATAFTNCTLTWTAASGAAKYNIYRNTLGVFGKIGESTTTTYLDDQPFASSLTGPPTAAVDFSTTNNYPSAVATHQQRLILGATNNNPDKMWASVTAQPFNFTVRDPIEDSDMVSWRQVSKRAVEVRHLLDIAERLLSFANIGEYVIRGNDAGVLVPDSINPVQLSYNGSGGLEPLPIDDTALYVQARGNQIRNLVPSNQDGYTGTEVSWTANHLLDGYALDAWAYQEVPHSTVWMVRDDGAMLSLTYFRDAGVIGWAKHDTDGSYESVATVEEGTTDAVYVVVNRTINGVTKRYIERFTDRVDDATVTFVDAGVRTAQASGVTIAVSNLQLDVVNNAYTADVDSSGNAFTEDSVGDYIFIKVGATWTPWQIITYTSATEVTIAVGGSSDQGVTATTYARTDWMLVPDLTHLRGENISVVLDGITVASPNNTEYDTATVSNLASIPAAYGTATFTVNPEQYAADAIYGLPYTTDLQTLDLDAAGTTIKDKGLNVAGLIAWVEDTEKFWAGPKPPTTDGVTELEPWTPTNDEGYPVTAGEDVTGVAKLVLKASWNNTGRVFLRNVDPTPMTVLAIIPQGFWGGR